jgi:murein DD-endopeptidase MepM/ murein hydrolase activator NlpD
MRASATTIAIVAAVVLVAATGLAQTGRYTVRRGDTLTGIAAANKTSVAALATANGIQDPNRIVIGQSLTLPDAAAAAAPTIIKVQPGDTLTKLAARTGIPAATLIAANGLVKPYTLYLGGQLFAAPRNTAATVNLARCPVPSAKFMNDWGFPRADTGFHQGNDMMAKKGTAIVAPVSGTVTQGTGTIGGNFFRLVGADGTMYYGAHMSTFGKAGKVKAGDVLGTVGNTGDAAGGATHLHFEIHPAGGSAVNPYAYLVAACR